MAARPLVTTKSPVVTRRDITSLNHEDDLQWRTNLSFSPAAGYSRDGLEHDTRDDHQGLAVQPSRSRGRKRLDPMANLVSASRPQTFQPKPRWPSWVNSSGPRTHRSQPECSNEVQGLDRSSSAMSMSFRSSTTFSESSAPWESSSTQPFSPGCCSYSRVFCNPVSDWENPDVSTNPRTRFMKSPTPHQSRISDDDEPTPNLSNSTSSKEMLLGAERFNETKAQNQRFPLGSVTPPRCGVCRNLLSQKSPWCSNKIMRSRDMPTAGVFPCHHVYHVECLDQVTLKAQTRDPPCPVCSNTIAAMEQPLMIPETLQTALRSLRRSHTTMESEPLSIPCNDNQRQINRRSHKWQRLGRCLNIRVSSSSRDPR